MIQQVKNPVIEIHDLTVSYDKKPVLWGVDRQGEIPAALSGTVIAKHFPRFQIFAFDFFGNIHAVNPFFLVRIGFFGRNHPAFLHAVGIVENFYRRKHPRELQRSRNRK